MTTEGNNQQKYDSIEALRLILERKQNREVAYEEALDIGESLVTFFEVLAEEVVVVSSDTEVT